MRASPVVHYASRSGESTLDQGDGGGNPFVSAIVELLGRPSLTLTSFGRELVDLTKEKSWNRQQPEISYSGEIAEWVVRPCTADAKRVAVVFVYSDYSRVRANSLPGAAHDLRRIANALDGAGFRVTAILDPSNTERIAALEHLALDSRDAEAAAVYVTGHGFEHDGEVYLLPGDFPLRPGQAGLADFAIRVAGLADYVCAADSNLVFYGGCRTHWHEPELQTRPTPS